jgi:hypothetical protein
MHIYIYIYIYIFKCKQTYIHMYILAVLLALLLALLLRLRWLLLLRIYAGADCGGGAAARRSALERWGVYSSNATVNLVVKLAVKRRRRCRASYCFSSFAALLQLCCSYVAALLQLCCSAVAASLLCAGAWRCVLAYIAAKLVVKLVVKLAVKRCCRASLCVLQLCCSAVAALLQPRYYARERGGCARICLTIATCYTI